MKDSDDSQAVIRRKRSSSRDYALFELEKDNEIAIKKFSDILCANLEQNLREQNSQRVRRLIGRRCPDEIIELERITGNDGSKTRPVTTKQSEVEGRTIGSAVHKNCYVCRKYLKQDGRTNYRPTIFQCKLCKMPICKKSRVDMSQNRLQTCMEEHIETTEHHLMCTHYKASSEYPKEKQVPFIQPRRSTRRRSYIIYIF